MGGTVHVIGAGLAGLAAALKLDYRHRRIVLHEAARHAGGRCRSYYDATLGQVIDNGNHLVLSGNVAVRDYIDTIGAPCPGGSSRAIGACRGPAGTTILRSADCSAPTAISASRMS